MRFPEITEAEARDLIGSGLAGYWEASLRDSLGKNPIPHDLQMCVSLGSHWYLVPTKVFKVVPHGRHAVTSAASANVFMIECHDPELVSAIQEELKRKNTLKP